jgi:dephospho-CoA kinase
MTTTDTPRTDDRCYHYDSKWKTMTISPFGEHIEAAFSRQLERELDEAQAEHRQWLENREKSTFQNWIDRAEKAEAEVERLSKLTEDCLNVIRVYCPTYYNDAMERLNKTDK